MCISREEAERQARAEDTEREAEDVLTDASQRLAREQEEANQREHAPAF